MSSPSPFPEQFQARSIAEASAKLGLTPTSIEKDWWVFLTLRALFAEEQLASRLTFKGGTSLSKVFGLIDRFSEDIDLVLDRRSLGFVGDRDPERDLSRTMQKRLIEQLKSECSLSIQKEVLPVVQKGLTEFMGESSFEAVIDPNDPDRQTLLVKYKSMVPSSVNHYVQPSVKVELGARSGDEPVVEGTVQPFLGKAFPDTRWNQSVTVRALDPTRTFLEKMCLMHEEYYRSEKRPTRSRMSRHLYDLSRLFRQGIATRALADLELLERVRQNRMTYFYYGWLDYATMKPGSFRLVPPKEVQSFWRNDFETLRKEMIPGNSPNFDELLKDIQSIEILMNAIKT